MCVVGGGADALRRSRQQQQCCAPVLWWPPPQPLWILTTSPPCPTAAFANFSFLPHDARRPTALTMGGSGGSGNSTYISATIPAHGSMAFLLSIVSTDSSGGKSAREICGI